MTFKNDLIEFLGLPKEGEIVPIEAKKSEAIPYTNHKMLVFETYGYEKKIPCPFCTDMLRAHTVVDSYTPLGMKMARLSYESRDQRVKAAEDILVKSGKKIGATSLRFPIIVTQGRAIVGVNTFPSNIGRIEQIIFER